MINQRAGERAGREKEEEKREAAKKSLRQLSIIDRSTQDHRKNLKPKSRHPTHDISTAIDMSRRHESTHRSFKLTYLERKITASAGTGEAPGWDGWQTHLQAFDPGIHNKSLT